VVDKLGLGDPVASRLRLEQRGRPGHEKIMGYAWAIARFSDSVPRPADVDPGCSDCLERLPQVRAQVPAARRALDCGILSDVIQAVTEPMGPSRFLDNLVLAPRATSARFAADPEAASRELCD
jgi:arabinofuranosyltransferase